MLEITNQAKFNQIVSDALEAAMTNSKDEQTARRWERAIEKTVDLIENQPEWLTYFADENYLLIWSQGTNKIYSANGKCQCKAFEQNQPCKHRAAARLVRIYFGGAENKTPRFPNEPQADVTNILPPADSETYRELSLAERNAIYEATGGGEAYGEATRRAESSDYLTGVQTGAFRFVVFDYVFHGSLETERESYEQARPSKKWFIWLQDRFSVEIGGVYYKQNETPYLKQSSTKKPESVGGYRI